ncbi:hypothetical protein LY76DRAFT_71094 [Colletotrichum caudatum]|nr:hypothetical protein LY76DRAFT_71094 [Colletotrichum caudatum]
MEKQSSWRWGEKPLPAVSLLVRASLSSHATMHFNLDRRKIFLSKRPLLPGSPSTPAVLLCTKGLASTLFPQRLDLHLSTGGGSSRTPPPPLRDIFKTVLGIRVTPTPT